MDDQTVGIIVEFISTLGVSGIFLYLLARLWTAYQGLLAKQTELHIQYVADSGAIRDRYVSEITKIHANNAAAMTKITVNYVEDLKQVFSNHVATLEKLLAEERNESQLERSRVVTFGEMQTLATPVPDDNKTQPILKPDKINITQGKIKDK